MSAPRDSAPDGMFVIGDATAGLNLNTGWRKLDIEETPKHTLVAPGAAHIFNTEIRSTGTGAVQSPTFINPIPNELLLDDTYGHNASLPFTVTYDLAPGSPAPPDIADLQVELLTEGSRYSQVKVTWPGWSFTPDSKIDIKFRFTPAPGVHAGDILANPVGITGTNHFSTTGDPVATPANTCEQPDETSDNFGVNPTPNHLVCLSDAEIEITSGNALVSRKYVAGNPDLGFYNTLTNEYTSVENPGSCLTFKYAGTTYVQYPCIALIYPGEKYDHIMGLRNAGTNNLLEVRIVDGLPIQGDTSLLNPGERGTEWDPRPTLAGEVVTPIAEGFVETLYSTDTTACVEVLKSATGVCGYSSTFTGADTGSFYTKWDLRGSGDELVPGGILGLQMPMNSPIVLGNAPNDMPVAWNSMADTAWAAYGSGEMKLLQSEPTKSGIAMLLGDLVISKNVNGKAKDVPNPASFDIRYKCTATPEGGSSQVVADDTVTVEGGKSVRVPNLPAKAVCKVWEPNPQGGASDAPSESKAKQVTIPPSSGPASANPAPQVTVQVNNTFGQGKVRVRKKLDGSGAKDAKGPWKFDLTCAYNDSALPVRTLTATRKKMSPVASNLPVGATCTVKETTTKGLAKDPEITPSQVTVSSAVSKSTFTVVNTYKAKNSGDDDGGGSGNDGGGSGDDGGGSGNDGGNLPGTGAGGILALLILGLGAVAGGTYLVRRSRTS